jgi:hypothetical protein
VLHTRQQARHVLVSTVLVTRFDELKHGAGVYWPAMFGTLRKRAKQSKVLVVFAP